MGLLPSFGGTLILEQRLSGVPNGKYDAQCYTCDFFLGRSRPSCKIHDFTLPRIDPEVICRDWRLAGGLQGDWHFDYAPRFVASEEFTSLNHGVLYQSLDCFESLGTFEHLQNLWTEVRVYPEDELGWAIYLPEDRHEHFPKPGDTCAVRLDEIPGRFRVQDVPRRRLRGGHRSDDGRWISRWEETVTRVVSFPETPAIIKEWLNRYFDIESLVTYYREKPGWAMPDVDDELSIALFVEVVKRGEEYALHPDVGLYRSFVRR